MEVGLSPGHIVLDGGPISLLPKKRAQPPIFGSCPLWPNDWMDQDATGHGGRPQPRTHCVRSSPPKKGTAAPQFSAHECCDQTAGWIKCHWVWR